MGFQIDNALTSSWPIWPFARVAGATKEKDAPPSPGRDSSDDDADRAFELADSVEKGLAREVVTEYMHPLRRSSKLWRFNIVRSDDKLKYRLFTEGGDFLMYATANLQAQKVEFFLYGPGDNLYDPTRPAFTMTFSADRREWRIVQERCEHCQFAPKHLSCACKGKQQVAAISHHRMPIGDGIFNGMELHVPGLCSDGRRVVWCPALGKGDLGRPLDGSNEAHALITRKPVWNDHVESLVLDFKGRHVLASAKNFQLALPQKPDRVVCQFGKIGQDTFSLDFQFPLSVIQAFGSALTTIFWT